MEVVTSKSRNRLDDESWESRFRVTASFMRPDIENLVTYGRRKASHWHCANIQNKNISPNNYKDLLMFVISEI
jgi:hypothetical protein